MRAGLRHSLGAGFLCALAIVGVASPASAVVQYLSVSWNTSQNRTIHYRFDGVFKTGRIGPASIFVDEVSDGLRTPGGRSYNRAFCIDLFETAPSPGEWDVREYTGADGLTGWTTPGTGTDHYRDHGSLTRAAWLTNTFATPGIAEIEKVALNVVLWKAAYGDRFEYVDGLSAGAQTDAYNTYLAAYNLGYESHQYRWFDSDYDDQDDTHQDFITPVVPEPGTVLLLGTGLLGSALAFRRRRS